MWCEQRKASPTIRSPTIPTIHVKEFYNGQEKTYRHFPLSSQVCKGLVSPCHPSSLIRCPLPFLYSMHSSYLTPGPSVTVQSLRWAPEPLAALFQYHTSLHHRKPVSRTTAPPPEHHSKVISLKEQVSNTSLQNRTGLCWSLTGVFQNYKNNSSVVRVCHKGFSVKRTVLYSLIISFLLSLWERGTQVSFLLWNCGDRSWWLRFSPFLFCFYFDEIKINHLRYKDSN